MINKRNCPLCNQPLYVYKGCINNNCTFGFFNWSSTTPIIENHRKKTHPLTFDDIF